METEEELSVAEPLSIKNLVDQYNKKQLLRFTTAGSVDDGKSTLIGRLLYDSKSVLKDQLHSITKLSQRKGYDYVDLSLLTDGLKSEREQGITIDVAYRYFTTARRKFIIADTPGHIQYTRNMVTGASTANLAIILIDARKGLVEQTYRHAYIASLLRIPHLVICINKMDLVSYDQEVYTKINSDFKKIAVNPDIHDLHFIPISALMGDNVVEHSKNMPWYPGTTLLQLLETIELQEDYNYVDGRLPVQYVVVSTAHIQKFTGRIASGIFRTGEKVIVLPSNTIATIKEIAVGDELMNEAYPPFSVAFSLDASIDIRRGDMVIKYGDLPSRNSTLEVMLCWMNQKSCIPGSRYVIQHLSNTMNGIVTDITHKVDINTLQKIPSVDQLMMNDIGQVKIELDRSIFYDSYWRNRITGSFILIDEETHETVAAAMIL